MEDASDIPTASYAPTGMVYRCLSCASTRGQKLYLAPSDLTHGPRWAIVTPMAAEPVSARVKVSITPSELEQLQQIADDEARSISNVVRFLIREYLAGYEIGQILRRDFNREAS